MNLNFTPILILFLIILTSKSTSASCPDLPGICQEGTCHKKYVGDKVTISCVCKEYRNGNGNATNGTSTISGCKICPTGWTKRCEATRGGDWNSGRTITSCECVKDPLLVAGGFGKSYEFLNVQKIFPGIPTQVFSKEMTLSNQNKTDMVFLSTFKWLKNGQFSIN